MEVAGVELDLERSEIIMIGAVMAGVSPPISEAVTENKRKFDDAVLEKHSRKSYIPLGMIDLGEESVTSAGHVAFGQAGVVLDEFIFGVVKSGSVTVDRMVDNAVLAVIIVLNSNVSFEVNPPMAIFT